MSRKKILPLSVLAVSTLCLLASCGASSFTHDLNCDIKHYEADLNHDGDITDGPVFIKYKSGEEEVTKTYRSEKNLTWEESYDALVEQTNDVEMLDAIADTMKISKDDVTKPYRTNLARYEILHQVEELVMSTGAIMPLYNYEDSFMIKEDIKGDSPNIHGMYSSALGYKFFERMYRANGNNNFNVTIGSKAQTMDPTKNSTVEAATMISQCLMGAKRWVPDDSDSSKHFAAKLDNGLCTYEKEVKNGKATYTFTIKKYGTGHKYAGQHIKWQDGNEITADDFIWAWLRSSHSSAGTTFSTMFDCIEGFDAWHDYKNPTSYSYYNKDSKMFSGIERVYKTGTNEIDPYSFKVKLVNDCAYFDELLAFPAFMPLPRHTMTYNTGTVSETINDSWWKTTSGTHYFCANGPFKFTKIDNKEGGSIVCEPNEYYLYSNEVKTNKLSFALIDDDSASLTQYKSGTLDFIDAIAAGSIDDMKAKYPKEFLGAEQTALYYFLFNVNDNTFDLACNKGLSQSEQETKREKLRWVMNLLVNRNDICTNVGKSGQTPSSGLVSEGVIESCLPTKPEKVGTTYYVPNTDQSYTIKPPEGATAEECWCVSVHKATDDVTYIPDSTDWQKRNKPFSGFLKFADSTENRYNVFADRTETAREDGLQEGFFPTFSGKDSSGEEIKQDTATYKNSVKHAQELYIQAAFDLAKEAGIKVTGNSPANYMFVDFPQVKLTMNTGTGNEQVAEKMQYYFRLFGINLQVETQEWNSFCSAKSKGNTALARNGWTADYRDPRTYLDIYLSNGKDNDCQLGRTKDNDAFIHYSK